MALGERIWHYRKMARMSQEELAARVGVSRQAVSKWELGTATPELEKLVALAETFGVSVDELLGREPAGRPEPEEEGEPFLQEEKPGDGQREPEEHWEQVLGFLTPLVRRFGWLAGGHTSH